MSYSDFYDPYRVTLPFWAWGKDYTIVPNRHIGIDIGRWGGKTATVPALASGRVVRVRWTKAMGMCVVLQVGDRFHAYCHLANDDLPRWGTDLKRGERVGRLAIGSRSESSIDFPGTAWGGIHLHLVVTNHPDAAYTYPRVRGSEFYDPAITIANALAQAAGGDNSRPFEPEEDDMYDAEAEKRATERLVALEKSLTQKLDDVARVAAPFKVFQWGTGHVVVNPENGRLWILPQGYGELLTHLGYRAGDVKSIGDGELGFITRFLPDAIGIGYPAASGALSDQDLAEIKNAIGENRVAVSQEQLDALTAAAARGASEGGEAGVKRALENMTLVVKTG